MLFGLRVPFYIIGLKVFGYQRVRDFKPGSIRGNNKITSIDYAKHQGKLVNMAVSAIAGGDNCLLRSVMLGRHLEKAGIAPQIIFGLEKHGLEFKAHSWVEVDGIVVNDRDDIATSHTVFEGPNK